jgi:hypothetical protein
MNNKQNCEINQPSKVYLHMDNEIEHFVDVDPLSNIPICSNNQWRMQSHETVKTWYERYGMESLKNFFNFSRDSFISSEWAISQLEDILLLVYNLYTAENPYKIIVAVVTYFKCRLGPNTSAIKYYVNAFQKQFQNIIDSLFSSDLNRLQSSIGSPFEAPRDFLDHYQTLKKSPLFTKIYNVLLYCLSRNVLDGFGINFESLNFERAESEALRRAHSSQLGFFEQIADTIVFLCETGYQMYKTGSFEPIYHCGTKYTKWYDDCAWLKDNYPKLDDCTAFGFSFSEFYDKLKDTIVKGDSIYKHAVNMSSWDKKAVLLQLQPLKTMCTEIETLSNARLPRKTPFSILLHGDSGIGKSTLIEIMFSMYGKKRNLPIDGRFKYTRNANANFWDGYMPSQWCCVLDDVGFREPRTASQGDVSVTEFLQIINQVPFCPDQADLGRKGRTPFKSEFVVATTNVKELNAFAYFSHPSAAQRRFPFVVTPSVKEEFRTNSLLDTQKVKESHNPTDIPDFWTFTVERVIPQPICNGKQNAIYHKILDNVSMKDFLIWYNETIDIHWNSQEQVTNSVDIIHNMDLCKCCGIPVSLCTASPTIPQSLNIKLHGKWYHLWLMLYMWIYFATDIYFSVCNYIRSMRDSFKWLATLKRFYDDPIESITNSREYWSRLGERVRQDIGDNSTLVNLASAVAGAVTLYTGAKLVSYIFGSKDDGKMDYRCQRFEEATTFYPPEPKEKERSNVWHNPHVDLAPVHISDSSRAMRGQEMVLAKKIEENMICCELLFEESKVQCRMLCIVDQYYLVNNHCLLYDDFVLNIFQNTSSSGVNRNMSIKMSQTQIYRDFKHDLAVMKIPCLPPRRNIVKYFLPNGFRAVMKGEYIELNPNGTRSRNPVSGIAHGGVVNVQNKFTVEVWGGVTETQTYDGYCGTPLLVTTPQGPAIAGIHCLGSWKNNHIGCAKVPLHYLESLVNNFKPTVEINDISICSESVQRELGELHDKSVFRFIEQGSASVYGSFVGYRPAPKSTVKKTMLCDDLLTKGYSLNHTAPLMRGWRPWRIAALDLVDPVLSMDQYIIDRVTEDFILDIMSNLSLEDLKTVHKYDRFTAVNGSPGVAYVDGINRNSSMGLPYRKPKNNYLNKLPASDLHPDPVEFNDEINRRIDKILETYSAGKRAYPIYNACLKDEAVSLSKREKGKTRVFSSAPVDFSIVVRMYLLSFVRLVQNNKYIFESCPGTVCQSKEWGQLRNFLTQFGDKRMIAGDFKAFDKRMSAQIMEAAFKVISHILKASGNYSDEDLLAVHCISADVRFPLTDFNGDLVEFYGSNPSGWPLTVIINGLVNCLYMRYAYALLSGKGSAQDFRKNVALLTYGDDNIMGVHSRCKWFNHTAISEVLGECDIVYTMADKKAESIPYLPIKKCEFLKRSWRWDKDVEDYLCPLNHDSIEKMLTVCVRSKVVIHEVQMCAIIDSALQEYFNYGRSTFEQKRDLFSQMIIDHDLQQYLVRPLPTFNDLVERWKEASENL